MLYFWCGMANRINLTIAYLFFGVLTFDMKRLVCIRFGYLIEYLCLCRSELVLINQKLKHKIQIIMRNSRTINKNKPSQNVTPIKSIDGQYSLKELYFETLNTSIITVVQTLVADNTLKELCQMGETSKQFIISRISESISSIMNSKKDEYIEYILKQLAEVKEQNSQKIHEAQKNRNILIEKLKKAAQAILNHEKQAREWEFKFKDIQVKYTLDQKKNMEKIAQLEENLKHKDNQIELLEISNKQLLNSSRLLEESKSKFQLECQTKLDGFQKRYSKHLQHNQILKNQVNSLKSQNIGLNQLIKRFEKEELIYQETIRNYKSAIQQTQHKIKNNQEKHIKSLEQKNKELQQQKQMSLKMKKVHQDQLQKLLNEKEDLIEANQKYQILQQEIEQSMQEIIEEYQSYKQTKGKQLIRKEELIKKLELKIDQYEKTFVESNNNFEKIIEQNKSEIMKLQSNILSQRHQLSRSGDQIEKRISQIVLLKQQLSNLKYDLEKEAREVRSLKDQNRILKEACANLESYNKISEQAMKDTSMQHNKEIQELKAKCKIKQQKLVKDTEKLNMQIKQMAQNGLATAEAYRRELIEKQQYWRRQSKTFEQQYEAIIEQQKISKKSLEQKVFNLEGQLINVKGQLQNTFTQNQIQISNLEGQISKLQKDIQEEKKRNEKYDQYCKQITQVLKDYMEQTKTKISTIKSQCLDMHEFYAVEAKGLLNEFTQTVEQIQKQYHRVHLTDISCIKRLKDRIEQFQYKNKIQSHIRQKSSDKSIINKLESEDHSRAESRYSSEKNLKKNSSVTHFHQKKQAYAPFYNQNIFEKLRSQINKEKTKLTRNYNNVKPDFNKKKQKNY